MKGKTAVFRGAKQPFEIREFPLPEVEAGAILIKVRLANICGSDLHIWRGETPWGGVLPTVIGHEMIGTVYQTGAGVKSDSLGQPLAQGDRVVYQYFSPCGSCPTCLKGDRAACPQKYAAWFATSCEQPPHFVGAYGEYYYLRPGQYVFKVPEEVSDEIAAPVNCALSQVIYGFHRVSISFGDTVVIQGAGGLGLYATAVAKEAGAGKVIVVDRLPQRLELARAFGADYTLNVQEMATPRERVQKVRELTTGRGADLVVELTGSAQLIPEGMSMLYPGGSYLLMGSITRGATVELDPSLLVLFGKKLVGLTTYEPWVIPRALDFLRRYQKKYPFPRLLSHQFPLAEINQAFQQADQGKVIRAALVP